MSARLVSFLVFLGVSTSILVGVHYYIWARFVRDAAIPPPWRSLVAVALIVLGVSLPLAAVLGRFMREPWLKPFLWGAYLWMGVMFLLFIGAAAIDVLRLVALSSGKLLSAQAMDPERRLFFARAFSGSAAVVALGSAAFGFRAARATPRVREVKVPLTRLPQALSGSTIVQLSDVHVGPTIDGAWLSDVVERVNAMNPDVVAITGDLVDGDVDDLRSGVAPLANLRAKHGVYFVTGNHEYYSGADGWIAELSRLGIRVLRNERVSIGSGDLSYDLAGVDDYSADRFGNGHGADLPKALTNYDESRELVLLAHQPRAIFEAAKRRVGLMLSGHTHGGQIWPWGYLVRLQQPYVQGLSKHDDTYIYVSRGTGYWGPPIRLGAPPEITRIELVRATA